MATNYAIDAANRMIAALDDNSVLSPIRIHDALDIGCKNLKRVSADLEEGRPLARDMAFLEEQRREFEADFFRTIETVESFAEAFHHIETEALRDAGASEQLLRLIPTDRARLLDALRREDLRAPELKSRIDRLSESVCESRDSIASLYLSPSSRRTAKNVLRRGAKGLFGSGVVSVNAGLDIGINLGLVPWASALSGAFGSAMVGDAVFGD